MKSSVWFLTGIFCATALTSSFAQAGSSGGHELGNGGDVFFCPGNKVEVVDIYEARIAGRKIEIGPEGVDYKAKLQSVFNKWSQVSPLRMKRYQEWLDSFESESRFIPESSLPNIGDEGTISIPQGCEIRQVAIQLADADLGSFYKRYTITKDLWDRMDENNRAALVLHELIFREAIATAHRVSLRVRYLNGILLSNSSIDEYVKASVSLNGMFLEWGWGGLERAKSTYGYPMDYSLTADSFQNRRENYTYAKSFWLGSEFFNLTYTSTSSNETCQFYGEIRRNDVSQFLYVNPAGPCSLYGKILYTPDAQESVSLFDGTKIENQTSPIQLSFDDPQKKIFTISGLSSMAKVSKRFEWSNSDLVRKIDLNCVGLSLIKKHPYSGDFSGMSESGSGQCTVQRTQVNLNGGGTQKDSYTFQSFHRLSFMTLYDFSHWLRVWEFDGTQSIEIDLQVGPSSVKCEQNPKDPDGYLNCEGIPTELTCEIPVIDSAQGLLRTRAEKLKIADSSQLRRIRVQEKDKVQETFEIIAPAGQVYRYTQGFFSENPQNLNRSAWMSFRFEGGKCFGAGKYRGI